MKARQIVGWGILLFMIPIVFGILAGIGYWWEILVLELSILFLILMILGSCLIQSERRRHEP